MFDLELAVSEWRQRMMAAGIENPAPLEELELHLRDEIERQKNLGLSVDEAFEAAVENFGESRVLQREFGKVRRGRLVLRAIGLSLGWLLVACGLGYCVLDWEFSWNFIGFHTKWNWEFAAIQSGILIVAICFWFLAKASRDWGSRAVSLLVCLALAVCAAMWLHADESAHGIFGGHYTVPFGYRCARTLALCWPGFIWAWWLRRHLMDAKDLRAAARAEA
ncbi:MAG TPA: permease prefix domain 1-containing protein [Verrucomicrobiae bacterium]